MVYQSSGWRRVTDDAGFEPAEIGIPEKKPVRVRFEEPITIDESGYIYVWVSNQSKETRVWFDDLRVKFTDNIVVQTTDYGAWGDVMREEKTDESVYRYAYQGQYAERDEETGWHHFELREYDPVIGRFTSVDPAGQFYSPYMGMGNDPVNGVDPDGGTTFDQGINSKGEVVYDNGINNGNIFLVNEGYNEKITSLDQLKANSTQVVNEWVWQENSRISVMDFVGLQTKFAYPGMDFGKKENWNIIERPGKNGLTALGAVTWGSKGGKGFVGLSDEARGLDIIYNPGKKNIFFGNIYNLRSIISHEGFHFNQRTLIPSSGKYFDKVLDARNWVEKGAINYQRGNKWWGKVNFQSPTWPKQTVTKDQWANSY